MPRLAKWGAEVVLGLAGLAVVALAGAIVFGTAAPPPPLATVRQASAQIAREAMDAPPPRRFVARDGSPLAYRAYPAAPDRVTIVIHGSSGSSLGVHGLARALQAAGITVYAPDVRGHGESGRKGDIDYVGQLDDDLVDLLAALEPPPPGGKRLLAGFSAGGGFVLRVAGGPVGGRFGGYLLLAPMVGFDSPTSRPWGDRWAAPSISRIVALAMLSSVGIHWLEHLPVIAFAIAPQEVDAGRTPAYSFRLWANFGSRRDWRGDIRRIRRPARVLIGEQDELFFADRYAPTFHAVRGDIAVEVLPGLDHAGPVVAPAGRAAVIRALTALFATPPRPPGQRRLPSPEGPVARER